MTAVVFQNARLIDPEAGEERRGEIFVSDGRIVADRPANAEVIDCAGMCLAPGIVDIGVKIGEPGERHKESFKTAGQAAAAGGVTTMIIRPDTSPAIDAPETLAFVARRAAEVSRVRVETMAALTKGRLGREMVEIGFLSDAGAVAFTDCDQVVENTKVLSRALTYAKHIGALVMGHPQEPGLSKGAAATAGEFAATKGLPAVSTMAERIGLERDLAFVEMTGARYHADNLSAAAALEPLARAKAAGLDVTAGVNIHHLIFNQLDVGEYRTFFKMKPPLRAEADRIAMLEAVASGLIDTVSSFHTPQDEESKRLPFEEAASGAVGLQTLLPAAIGLARSGAISLPVIWRAMSTNPARRFGLEGGSLAPGAPADLVLFDPDAGFTLDRFTLKSKAKNTPFDGAQMHGVVRGTWVGGARVFGA
ncbi:MAG: dihydroorotase [Rhodobacterales bacterium]|nr:MAG: dihydroorotase [Rhodobacterales bacterium]